MPFLQAFVSLIYIYCPSVVSLSFLHASLNWIKGGVRQHREMMLKTLKNDKWKLRTWETSEEKKHNETLQASTEIMGKPP